MNRFLPKSLAGQLIAVLLLALVVAQIVSLMILHDDRRSAFRFVAQQEILSRTASVVRLLNKTEPELHQTIVDAASSRSLRFEVGVSSAVDDELDNQNDGGINRFLQRRLKWELCRDTGKVRVAVRDIKKHGHDSNDGEDVELDDKNDKRSFWAPKHERWFRDWRSDHRREGMFRHHRHGRLTGMTISVALGDQSSENPWLNVHGNVPSTNPAFAITSLLTISIMALLMVLIVIILVRRVTRPLAQLSSSAERLGLGEDVGPLPESGPRDIRNATRAFNDMQERLQRFVQDRIRMLAAITHDLRTPITSLRIRAEMIEEPETRDKILETLAEMQALTEAALDFARQEASDEVTRDVDLAALVDSLCADMAELGEPVEFVSGEVKPLVYACRPVALKRVLRNLIENAVRYGERARVGIALNGDVRIHVDDDGAGIAAEDRERIFEPFFRLEDSRSRDTGGIGLGLAIARTIIRAHGGEIDVTNGDGDDDGGGARFTVRLPGQG